MLILSVLCLTACEHKAPPETAANNTASAEPAARPVADAHPAAEDASPLTQAARWSAAEAAEHLSDADPRVAVAAALRLLSIRDARPACIPASPTAAGLERLVIRPLGRGLFALGIRTDSPRALRCPVLLTADGEVLDPVAGQEQPHAVLYLSADASTFPHLWITPTHVWAVGLEKTLTRALVGRKLGSARFTLRHAGDTPYVALVWQPPTPGGNASRPSASPPAGPPRELARYVWDPYELSFMGPQRDRLPDPPGGFFVLDVDASELLTPVGGDVPDPNDPNHVVSSDPQLKLKIPPDWMPPGTRPASQPAEPNEPNQPNGPNRP